MSQLFPEEGHSMRLLGDQEVKDKKERIFYRAIFKQNILEKK